MKKLFFNITLLLLFISGLNATEVNDFFLQFRETGKTDFQAEKELIESYKLSKLISQLAPFYSDSLVSIRQKAYYLTYKKGILEQSAISNLAVNQLLKGCYDENGGIVGQNLDFLKQFPAVAFDPGAKDFIKELLSKRQITHLKKTALLAGYVGAATDFMQQQLLKPDLSIENKWAFSLALARQGNKECIDYCVNSVKKVPISNELMYYIVPDLIYIRQKEATDYCVTILYNDKKLCSSSDPDNQAKILCGYYLMELLAPVIMDFPFKTDGTGSLVSNDYESALIAVRSWFKTNPNYTLNKEIF